MLELRDKIKSCTKCKLHKMLPDGCRPIHGVGPIDAKLFIVGEAPGADEVLLEEPFVGLCGRFLTKCLKETGIEREKCYISNVVKCRPTDNGKKNRPPSKEEINICYPWLNMEIDIIKPKVILGMGKVAMQFLLNTKSKMDGTVGEIFIYNHSQCICTYHPSYILQHGKAKQSEFMKHLKQTKALLDGI